MKDNNKVKIESGTLALKTIYLRVKNLEKSLTFFRELGFTSTHIEIDPYDQINVFLNTKRKYEDDDEEQEIQFCISEKSFQVGDSIMFGLRAKNDSYVNTLEMLHNAGVKLKYYNPLDLINDSFMINIDHHDFEGELANFRIENIRYEELQSRHVSNLEQKYGGLDEIEADESFLNTDMDAYHGLDGSLEGILIKVANIDEYIANLQNVGFSPVKLETKDGKIVKVEFILNHITNLKLIIQQDAACNTNNCITFLVGGISVGVFVGDGSESYFIDALVDVGELKLNRKVIDDNGIIMPNHASYTDLNKIKWLFFNANKVTI